MGRVGKEREKEREWEWERQCVARGGVGNRGPKTGVPYIGPKTLKVCMCRSMQDGLKTVKTGRLVGLEGPPNEASSTRCFARADVVSLVLLRPAAPYHTTATPCLGGFGWLMLRLPGG